MFYSQVNIQNGGSESKGRVLIKLLDAMWKSIGNELQEVAPKKCHFTLIDMTPSLAIPPLMLYLY